MQQAADTLSFCYTFPRIYEYQIELIYEITSMFITYCPVCSGFGSLRLDFVIIPAWKSQFGSFRHSKLSLHDTNLHLQWLQGVHETTYDLPHLYRTTAKGNRHARESFNAIGSDIGFLLWRNNEYIVSFSFYGSIIRFDSENQELVLWRDYRQQWPDIWGPLAVAHSATPLIRHWTLRLVIQSTSQFAGYQNIQQFQSAA